MSDCCILFTLSVDPSIGRIDKSSLSQQTLMELFISTITENKEMICGFDEDPDDISEWYRLKLNEFNEPIELKWSFLGLQGSIELKWLPLSSIQVDLTGNFLTGTVDLTCLPDGLEVLELSLNYFEGTVDLTLLPKSMKTLNLAANDLTGLTDFSQLPQSLRELDISETLLEGRIVGFKGVLKIEDSHVTTGEESD